MYHYSQGKATRQAHKGIPEGHFEEEQGTKGFFGPVSHLIRKNPSTNWVEIDGPLKPRMYDLVELPHRAGMQRMLFNQHMGIYNMWMKPGDEKEFVARRNADGDLLYFCHKGKGILFSDYGMLEFEAGHYVVVPKCITHAFHPLDACQFFVVENRSSHYEEPDRGPVGRNALYDANALVKPDLEGQEKKLAALNLDPRIIAVKHLDEMTTYKYNTNVFDVVGWKGDLYPFTLHVDHLMPLMSHKAHLPPSAHITFVARDFVVCTFVPRPLETDKDALKVPFYHQNIDYDEVLFYHDGDFFSRDNLHPGMMSFHPAGFAHGPHPKAMKTIDNKTETNEYAVMVDSRWPLQRDPSLDSVELSEYWKSWQG